MKYPCKLKFASTMMNKLKKEFHSGFTLAWIFTSKLVLRPDEYRGWERACPTGKAGNKKYHFRYTDRKEFCKNIFCFLYGITRSKQFCLCKPDKNEYNIQILYTF